MTRPIPHVKKLSLIGAGPGDPDLISVKGLRILEKVPVVLYDALVHPDLLDATSPGTILVPVGKRGGKQSMDQAHIHKLIVEYVFQYGHVARLKGGDPFVFGRGHEEMLFAQAYGIEVEIIPGISSTLAAPTTHQIPVSRRGISESFWVLTGMTRKREVSRDIKLAAQSTATMVIVMGMRNLAEIVGICRHYRTANTPVAVIQSATLASERIALGSLNDIEQEVSRMGLGSPAVIVIGDVVHEHPNYWKETVAQMLNGDDFSRNG